jgi:Trypsin-co-occurring domain 1
VKRLVRFPSGPDPEQGVFFEVDEPEPEGGPVRVGREDRAVETVGRTFEAALDPVRRGAEGLLLMLTNLSESPSEFTIEFGVSLNGEAQVFTITKLGAEAYFKVTLNWHREGEGGGGSR